MPTFHGKYEPPAPVARHRGLWLALLAASLPVTDQPRYARGLVGLYARFLDERTVPTYEEFYEVVSGLLALLRDTAFEEEGCVSEDSRYLEAARYLQLAEQLARRELSSEDDP